MIASLSHVPLVGLEQEQCTLEVISNWWPLTLASHPDPSPKKRGGGLCMRYFDLYARAACIAEWCHSITSYLLHHNYHALAYNFSIRSWWIILNAHNFILDALWQLGDKSSLFAGISFFRIEYWILDIESWFNFQFVLDIEYEARNQFLICWWKLKVTWTKHTTLCDYSIFNIIWISEMKRWKFKISIQCLLKAIITKCAQAYTHFTGISFSK